MILIPNFYDSSESDRIKINILKTGILTLLPLFRPAHENVESLCMAMYLARKRKKLSRKQLSQKSGISVGMIEEIEKQSYIRDIHAYVILMRALSYRLTLAKYVEGEDDL